jgi:hypothetical protein
VSNSLIALINGLVLLFALVALTACMRARKAGPSPSALALVIGGASLFGVCNAWLPALAALRDHVRPAQPVMVITLTAALLLLGWQGKGAVFFRTATTRPLVALHGWRFVFGLLLLASGLSGSLPANFWSVALGDIIAGLWAISIWQRTVPASQRELVAWSAFGLIDLIHLLPRAIIALPPFYQSHPDLFRPLLLPLLGVPMLIAVHILLLRRFFADGNNPEGKHPLP